MVGKGQKSIVYHLEYKMIVLLLNLLDLVFTATIE